MSLLFRTKPGALWKSDVLGGKVIEMCRDQILSSLVDHGKKFKFYVKYCWNLCRALKKMCYIFKRSLCVGSFPTFVLGSSVNWYNHFDKYIDSIY